MSQKQQNMPLLKHEIYRVHSEEKIVSSIKQKVCSRRKVTIIEKLFFFKSYLHNRTKFTQLEKNDHPKNVSKLKWFHPVVTQSSRSKKLFGFKDFEKKTYVADE